MKKKTAAAVLACLLLTGCGMDTMADSLADDIAGQLESLYGQNVTPEWQPNPETEPMPIQMPEPTKTAENSAIALSTAEDLEKLRANPSGSFALTQNITVDNLPPFREFNGTLDGQGYWIRVASLEMAADWSYALFYDLRSDAEVRNLNVEISMTFPELEPLGFYGLACMNSGRIYNCTVASKVKNMTYVYGLVGENNGSLSDCQVELDVENCAVLSGLTNRNWEGADIESCTVTVKGKSVQRFSCAATQNYAKVSGCTFDAQLTPPAGEVLSWDTDGYGESGDFDSSNTVNVREVD